MAGESGRKKQGGGNNVIVLLYCVQDRLVNLIILSLPVIHAGSCVCLNWITGSITILILFVMHLYGICQARWLRYNVTFVFSHTPE